MKKSLQANEQSPMICSKKNHNMKIQNFKFSKEQDKILQCLACSEEDTDRKKIAIDDILNFTSNKIPNYPPFKDPKQSQKVRKIKENLLKQSLDMKIQQAFDQIEVAHDNLFNSLQESIRKSRQQCINKLEAYRQQYVDISDYYNPEKLKKIIKKYMDQEITIQELFDEQLILQEEFEDQEKLETVLKQNDLSEQIDGKMENLKKQMQEQVQDMMSKFDSILKQFHQQEMPPLQVVQENTLMLIPMDHYLNRDDLIQINNNYRILQYNNREVRKYKAVYTPNLDKTKTHTLRMRVNFGSLDNDENNNLNAEELQDVIKQQYLGFCLINEDQKDSLGEQANFIVVNNHKNGEPLAGHPHKKFQKQGINFSDFWKNNETILTVRFNYQQKLFEAFDDQNLCYINSEILQDLIPQNMRLDITFFNDISVGDSQIEILDYQIE